MSEPFRQGSEHRPLRVTVFSPSGLVNLVKEFPGGIVFKMVKQGVTIIGVAVGDTKGNLSYAWQPGDLASPGQYQAVFIGTDGDGKTETFPTGSNLEIVVVRAL